MDVEGTWSQYSIFLDGMLCVLYIVFFVYILFKLVEILDFDGLVFKCCFFYVT